MNATAIKRVSIAPAIAQHLVLIVSADDRQNVSVNPASAIRGIEEQDGGSFSPPGQLGKGLLFIICTPKHPE